MVNEALIINEVDMRMKMFNNQRVVTFKDIDKVHNRPEGTAKRNFKSNREHFIEDVDFFLVKPVDFQKYEIRPSGIDQEEINNRGTMLFTETGYLMIVKSFTDDLAWKVQRKLINSYFKLKEVANQLSEDLPVNLQSVNNTIQELSNSFGLVCRQVNSMESAMDYQYEMFKKVMGNMTLSTRQQEKILSAARKRVNHLLGGAHSGLYKRMARIYLSNLWNNFKSELNCGSSYKDLNPSDFDLAINFINNWTYEER